MKYRENGVPEHIGVILDGNRRLAKKLMLQPWKGHEWGAKKVDQLFDWAYKLGVKELTLYAFSLENFNRPKEEFEYITKLFKKEFARLLEDKRVHERKVRVNFIGSLWKFDKELQDLMRKIMVQTQGYSDYIVNFAVAYGGQQEIIEAAKEVAKQVKTGELDIEDITKEIFNDVLWLQSEPDLIIRTGGDKRTSNFLNFQSAYSEWLFLEKFWPEFEEQDLIEAVDEYSKRKRRFGK